MQYQNFDENKSGKKWMPWALGIMTLLCLGATIAAIVFAINNDSSSSSSNECTSSACIELADSILQSLDTSVDPCDDFYQYSCGNWVDDNDWELVESSSYSQFSYLSNWEMERFLDALFYDTNASLVGHSSVIKSQIFYETCYNSDVDEEELEESDLLREFIEAVNFTNGQTNELTESWDDSSKSGFQDAISWLTARGWNFLFETSVLATGYPLISQDYDTWLYYNSTLFRLIVNETYVPLYESYFGLSQTQAQQMGQLVGNFADSVSAITTADIGYLSDYTLYYSYLRGTTVANWTAIFGQSDILNLTAILFDTFDTNSAGIQYILYFYPGLEFFSNLTTLIANTPPRVVQFWLYTSVLINGINFESTLEQSRSISRTEFCFYQLLEEFPFVYGYILEHIMFGTTKYNAVYELVENVLENGIRTAINSASWMDDTSRENSIKKVDYLGIYVGLPPRIGNYTALDIYYSAVKQASNSSFLENLASLLDFDVYLTQGSLKGTLFDMITPWPSIFDDSSSYDAWLTGINAFYVPSGNFFTIPVTISQVPYYDMEYPSSVNFGGLGGVIGHEISHGFDPDGSYYNYNGSYGDIWTTSTRSAYTEVEECFVEQYNGLEIEDGIYVNGTRTITENVADNGGVSASFTAWQSYIKSNGNDKTLPGVDLTSTQLFYWSWAHVWCEAYRSGYYDDWTDVHAPNPARVWGVVQNSDDFASAFNCKSGSAMNPTDKCVLW